MKLHDGAFVKEVRSVKFEPTADGVEMVIKTMHFGSRPTGLVMSDTELRALLVHAQDVLRDIGPVPA